MRSWLKVLLFPLLMASAAYAQQGKLTPDAVNGCVFNGTAPTLTTGQQATFQCDVNGNLKISGALAISNGSINTIPTQGASTEAAGTTSATPSAFTQVLPTNGNRLMCVVQNTATVPERVFLGATGSATSLAAVVVQAGGSFSCSDPGGTVATDAVQINSDTASQPFVVVSR